MVVGVSQGQRGMMGDGAWCFTGTERDDGRCWLVFHRDIEG